MFYSYPYYVKTEYGIDIAKNSPIYSTIDSSGTGSISFWDFSQFFDESDFYQNGSLVKTQTLFNEEYYETVEYSNNGTWTSFEYAQVDGYNTYGYRVLDGKNGYDRLDYIRTDSPTGEFSNVLKYTSSDGKYGYSYEQTGGQADAWDVRQSFDNPNTGSYNYAAHWLAVPAGGLIRLISADSRSITEIKANSLRQLSFDADHNVVRAVSFTTEGVKFDLTFEADGDKVTRNFDGGKISSLITQHTDGSSSEQYYNNLGATAKSVERQATGASDVQIFQNGVLTNHNLYAAGGKLAVTDAISADGSHLVTAHMTGQTLYGGLADDTFLDFGATTFVLGKNFGHDAIKGFDVGQAANSDLIALSADYQFSDLVFTQIGKDTVVHVTADDDITLFGVKAISLGHDDFMFV
ncbi:hypothetical protein ASG25_02950 [Rhizobium sp. Leaf384]|uniref:hypothetical protein n=1 Tax=unclassified Rhizobium TaxID=2613769 RepID=UPI0007152D92|nr:MULTISPECIES: hypothetical protein [unclassified Rhizobium]KQS80012.1 hypothetical protein ASG58_22670 [Rhizobium sp. Leaf383]KQS80557.1 hypothetical protein ASG25_02950 [Rhizobium sp. Leaf384]